MTYWKRLNLGNFTRLDIVGSKFAESVRYDESELHGVWISHQCVYTYSLFWDGYENRDRN